MTLKDFYFNSNEVGVDEAGRGPLLGRVYAGAVIWNPNKSNDMINDSKKLSSKKRKIILQWIKENLIWAVGYAEVDEIDKYNILNATKLAMDRALNNLNQQLNNTCTEDSINIKDVIIDGTGWEKKFNSKYNIKSIVKGDANYYSIACASIIAKEYHDEHINSLCNDNPELNEKYNISNNMGYGTKDHINGINTFGITKYHRHTFKPCCNFQKPE